MPNNVDESMTDNLESDSHPPRLTSIFIQHNARLCVVAISSSSSLGFKESLDVLYIEAKEIAK